jgi:hypothetical protein
MRRDAGATRAASGRPEILIGISRIGAMVIKARVEARMLRCSAVQSRESKTVGYAAFMVSLPLARPVK